MKKRSEFPKKTISSTVLVFEGCGVSKQILRGHPGTFVNTVSYQYCPYVKELLGCMLPEKKNEKSYFKY